MDDHDPLGWFEALAHREPCLRALDDVPCVLQALGNGDGYCPWKEWAQCEAEQRTNCPHIKQFPYWQASVFGGGEGREGYGATGGEAIAALSAAMEAMEERLDADATEGMPR